ncbi:substrate-binding domain-containing protein [Sporomusa acidovorans]|uniref:Tungstate-binding protein TupA n=1 Tax=Sporomusa acidovorans (strain ATCC 49682 / DSM 3132 / Mol) TaxID=1123286 RepID=A0ABZ3IXV0_SPOA4|nr:substrate-binding domain-containing protein [Sporomusa acidovorans]OZC23339.1 PBP superfamily domain protein [Sporomusa acidovorans DSM 3132]SDE42238.1 tungstate transport system substrate-binding protein [Sporomusa acidovorans]
MHNKNTSVFAVLFICLMLVGLAGCGTKPDKASPEPAKPQVQDVILATTTSTQDSGLLDVLIPAFEKKTGYKVKTIAVGTGQALAMGEKGEADVLLVHAPDAEKKVVASGAAMNRLMVMHNDFILVGPADDAAHTKGQTVTAALTAIAKAQAPFISRGDKSGTHQMEQKLWKQAGIAPTGNWYQEAGAGMGQTLAIANEKKGYTLTDRATYLAQKKNLALDIMVEGDPKLLNLYHVMEVNPEKFAKANHAGAKAFSAFILSSEGQDIIGNFGKDKYGQALFFADAGKTEKDFGL